MNHPESVPDDPREIVEAGYDAVADRYGRMGESEDWPRLTWLAKLLDRAESGGAVLDVGCGSGAPADEIIAASRQVVGVDVSNEQVRRARANVPDGRFMHADILSLDFAEGSFAAIVSFYTIEHVPRRRHEELLRRFSTWTSPGGYLLFSMEAGEYDDVQGSWLGVPMFLSCYDPERTKAIVSAAGYRIVETAIENQTEEGRQVPYLWVLARKT